MTISMRDAHASLRFNSLNLQRVLRTSGTCLSVAFLLMVAGCGDRAVVYNTSMRMVNYASQGPIRDNPHPALAFPVVDVFSPQGQLVDHTYSVAEATNCLRDHSACNPIAEGLHPDTLTDIAAHHPALKLPLSKLSGRYTVLFVSAPGCKSCALQETPLRQADLAKNDVNQVLITLSLQ